MLQRAFSLWFVFHFALVHHNWLYDGLMSINTMNVVLCNIFLPDMSPNIQC